MKVSIITVSFNSARTIQDTIRSVLSQTYPSIEYIIIDGGSTDGTKEIVRSFGHKIAIFVSEPDYGLYDAMNKGFKLATGDIIGILNSDDFYNTEMALSWMVEAIEKSHTDSAFADICYVQHNNPQKVVRYWKSKSFSRGSFCWGWHPPHPTFLVKKSVYEKYGYFDLSFKLAADFELMLRFLERYSVSCTYVNRPLISMRLGGVTNKNLKNIIDQNKECVRAFRKNSLPVSIFYPLFRLIPKLSQFIRRYSL
jgi:glycosyltransferase involved in cell wall biosynthesis